VSTLAEPIVLVLILGVVGGISVVVLMLLRTSQERAPRAHVAHPLPDRRAQRLDDAVAASPALRRALAVTTDLANRRGLLGSVERSLRAADVPVRPAELILAGGCAIVFVPLATLLVTRSPVLAGSMLVVVSLAPMVTLRILAARRRKQFAAQLPDALTTLAGTLRAGRSVGQAMDALSRELADPMGRELRKVVAETRLGRSLRDALADAAARIDSPDFGWTVLAIQIQGEVGGNLAELLDQVSSTVRERAQMKGEVKALTAEGRASAMMLVVLVPGLGLFMAGMNRAYMAPLVTTTIGRIMLGASFAMIAGGYYWMSRMVKIDV
jgi:tight adherence protein B